jgi:hypothetical protein
VRRVVLVALAVAAAVAAVFEVPRLLVFGWIWFLAVVLPAVTVDWGVLAVGAAALVLFAGGVHWAGWAWRRRAAGRPPWRFRWTLSVVALTFLLFASGVCLVGLTHQVAWLAGAREPLYGTSLGERYQSRAAQWNLKDLGMGALNYHSTIGRLPPGGTFTPDGAGLHSWETHLLPYLPYSTREIDMQSPWNGPRNEAYFKSVLPPFINPDFRTADLEDADGFGLSHYAANRHVFNAGQPLRLDQITDGPANTILFGEVNTGFKPWGDPVNWRDPAKGINASPEGFGGARSNGGARFVMADGSVRFVSEKVSPRVLQALATPAGGEPVDDSPR